MSIKGQGHSLTLVKGHSDFKVKCLTFGLYTQVSDSGPLGPLVSFLMEIPVNNVDPDQMPHYVASDLGLHCLPMTRQDVEWVKNKDYMYLRVLSVFVCTCSILLV